MGETFDHLMGDVKRLTACRTKCPKCGRIGMASWCRQENVCKCLGCGEKFDFKQNSYRPLTEGMSDEERKRFYKRNIKKRSELSPEELEREREMGRLRNKRYRENNRERFRASCRAAYWRKKERENGDR